MATAQQKAASELRALADAIEAGKAHIESALTLFHSLPVHSKEWGAVIVDHKHTGTTFIFSTFPQLDEKLLRDVIEGKCVPDRVETFPSR